MQQRPDRIQPLLTFLTSFCINNLNIDRIVTTIIPLVQIVAHHLAGLDIQTFQLGWIE
jgi:hypothetical protein